MPALAIALMPTYTQNRTSIVRRSQTPVFGTPYSHVFIIIIAMLNLDVLAYC